MKKILTQSIFDEEIRNKILIGIISIFLLILVLLLALVSFPSILINILFSSPAENLDLSEDIAKVAVYQDTVFKVDNLNKEWIEKTKKENSYCDEIIVEYTYDLTWQALISIDSVLLNQEFDNLDEKRIQEIALKFIERGVEISEEEYEEEYEVDIIDSNGNPKTITETQTVKIKVAIITVNTRSFEDVLFDVGITTEENIFIATNILHNIASIDVENSLNIYDGYQIDFSQLKEYPEGYANIPYYNQTDKRWGSLPYGSSTILSAGCGPTSLAMVVSGLVDNKVTPDIVADWSYRNGHRAEGTGSYWSLMTDGGKYYGLNVEAISRRNPNDILKALSDGYPVIVAMGKGQFTNGGHFIVLRGVTEEGKILVHDSASVERSNKEWDLSIIMNESSKIAGVNGSPFWIFRP
ncbi:C39 family peptidase [Alkaliphilus sp. B6464]|uniref:C39 family peptidase n=1 Tax=Alkaliphilus sp. B6464 TaxID=2731219 RepID=UPI001BA7C403|nr:C39 family peptidase [Alkaliphilus sp. B6464]QUH20405.1 C39 family peptidase [Alkaliphilus sp. B6464]